MRFAVALFALTFFAQTANPTFAQTTPESDEVANVPIEGQANVNALGGADGAAGLKPKMQFTDEQKEKFYEMKNKMLAAVGPKKVALLEEQRLLKDLLTQGTLDRKAIQGAQDKINSLRSDLANVHLAYRMDIQAELTPEQRKAIRYHGLKGKNHGKRHGGKSHRRTPRATSEESNTTSAAPTSVTSDASI